MKKTFKKLITLLMVIFLLVLGGCGDKNDEATENSSSESTSSETIWTEDVIHEKTDYETVAESDWKLKDNLVDGTDNLYMISASDLEGISYDYGATYDIQEFGDNILMLYGDTEGVYTLYEIEPYNLYIKNSVELPEGDYNSDSIKLYDDEITILNCATKEIYVYNTDLVIKNTISMGDITATQFIQSNNNKNIYYYDTAKKNIYKYDIESQTETELFAELNGAWREAYVEGVLGDDEWLVYYYYVEGSDGVTYEVRNISTGEVMYSSSNALVDAESFGDTYLFRYLKDNLYHMVCGTVGDEEPSVLSLYGYTNDSADVDYSELDFNLKTGYHNISKEYLMTYQWDEISESEKSILEVSLYDKNTGDIRRASMELLDKDAKYNYVTEGVFIPDENIIIFAVYNMDTKLFVWDLDMESSIPVAEENRLFDLHDAGEYDEETNTYLTEKANRIGEKHGVELYFADLSSCIIHDYSYDKINNAVMIDFALDVIDRELSKYPEGMIAQLDCGFGSKLKIYLASDLYGGELDTTIGVEATDANNTCIVLEIQGKFDDVTFHHELFHAIENYIVYNSGTMDTEEWNALNPEGHTYAGGYTANQEGGDYSGVGKYFVRPYSKAFSSEDRADIMGFSIGEYNELCQDMETVDGLNAKLAYLSEVIRDNFDTTGWPETTYWEDKIMSN